jgi:hypothetical protein
MEILQARTERSQQPNIVPATLNFSNSSLPFSDQNPNLIHWSAHKQLILKETANQGHKDKQMFAEIKANQYDDSSHI